MQIMDLCVGKPYTDKTTGQEKKRWVKVGAMFINHDEKTGDPRYSMKFDAYPTGDVFISAFPKKAYDPAGQNKSAATEVASPIKPLSPEREEEIKIEDVPF